MKIKIVKHPGYSTIKVGSTHEARTLLSGKSLLAPAAQVISGEHIGLTIPYDCYVQVDYEAVPFDAYEEMKRENSRLEYRVKRLNNAITRLNVEIMNKKSTIDDLLKMIESLNKDNSELRKTNEIFLKNGILSTVMKWNKEGERDLRNFDHRMDLASKIGKYLGSLKIE
ncbi:hypothetical protein [Paenibacillus ehimensis]|uniref:Uncharacterized protein n=1 Tax=Paenibacillus ehimensis TaxID=79264 RepID=A0ABT8VLX2_9BACL|nr:hypothetical protein [Paenibacillus ehimensis]MDO3681964.1 hypothetical protein [Paenibacillus ehimensis]